MSPLQGFVFGNPIMLVICRSYVSHMLVICKSYVSHIFYLTKIYVTREEDISMIVSSQEIILLQLRPLHVVLWPPYFAKGRVQ